MIELKTNKVNTDLDEQLLKSLTKEERETVLDYISGIVFLQNLTDPNRKYAKDLERWDYPNNDMILSDGTLERKLDPKGKVRVDLANPHILENTDYFREAAIHFETHGCYTSIKPNKNPYSDYRKFWDTQIERCWDGMVRESDGEWITGYHYFYLNFSPVMKSIRKPGSRRYDRVEALPDFYDGDYWFFHYITRSRDNGKHSGGLKKRGAGYSLKGASMLGRNFIVGESKEVSSKVRSIAVANEKEYLTKDGILNKFIDVSDFCSRNTPFQNRKELKDSWQSMHWQMGWKDNDSGLNEGSLNEVMGVTLKNDPEKARGKRAQFILWEEFGKFDNSIKAWNIGRPSTEDGEAVFGQMVFWGCLTENNKVWTADGKLISIRDIKQEDGIVGYDGKGAYQEKIGWFKPPQKKLCYKITTSGGDSIECSYDHPILWSKSGWMRKVQKNNIIKEDGKIVTFKNTDQIKPGDQILLVDSVPIFGNKEIEDATLIGLMIGDGNYSVNAIPQLSCGDDEIFNFIEKYYNYKVYKQFEKKTGGIYRSIGIKEFRNIARKIGIFGQTNLDKTLPKDIHTYNKESLAKVLGGYFDADGDVSYNKRRNCVRVRLTSKSESLLREVKMQLTKFGIHGKITKEFRKTGYKENTYIFRLNITSYNDVLRFKENIPLLIDSKNKNLDYIKFQSKIDRTRVKKGIFRLGDNNKGHFFLGNENMENMKIESVSSIECIGEQDIYNLHTTHSNTYLANNFITKQTGGTATEAFAGLREIFYNPRGYNCYELDNVWDKNSKRGSTCAFFHPGYLNQVGYMDKDGNSDVVMSLLSVIKKRIDIKYNSTEASSLPQMVSEMALTPQEAIMKVSGSIFPTVDIRDYLEECRININKFTSTHLVGDLVINSAGEPEFKTNFEKNPIRTYNRDKNNVEGAIEIFSLPQIDRISKRPYSHRYIAGIDPVDNDYVKTGSLASIFVFDLWNDEIVAEYTGRPQLADDFYEICRRLLIFYNAQGNYENNIKGLFGYFNNKSALHLLCDTPSYLRDVEEQKQNLFGNRSKGTRASIGINNDALRLQKTWMLTPKVKLDDKEKEVSTLTLRTIRSLGYLEELYEFNSDGNFDRISAMGMVMILRQDRVKITESLSSEKNEAYIETDKFINDNYDSWIELAKNKEKKEYEI